MSYKELELLILRDTLCLVSNVDCVSGLFILDCPFFFISRLFELLYIYIYLFIVHLYIYWNYHEDCKILSFRTKIMV